MQSDELLKTLSCPIDWSTICPETDFTVWLNFCWYAMCYKAQVDNEVISNFTDDSFLVENNHVYELYPEYYNTALHNIKSWISPTKNKYVRFFIRFSKLNAVGNDIYNKHYTNKIIINEELASKSIDRGVSVLNSYINKKIQNDLAWAALNELAQRKLPLQDQYDRHSHPLQYEANFYSLFDQKTLIIYVDFCFPIGASNGTFTQYGCINFDFSTPQFHIYPINKAEYDSSHLKCRVQGWNYSLNKL